MNGATFYLTNVCRRRGEAFCLNVGELTVRPGEILTLLGPTGAGKTSLLRLMSGVEYADEGSIEFNGHRLNRATPLLRLRHIAMVHQRPILLRGTVTANVAYGLRVRDRAPNDKVQGALNRLGLDRLAQQEARSLSGGQSQLVALARALVLEPEVLLLDEPTANLDPAYVTLIEKVIRETQAARRTTIVWATHNLFQARRMSHRAALLLDGNLVEVGDNTEFFNNPNDRRTAAFVEGKMVY